VVALAVFCSDPISSVAYTTEQIGLVLAARAACDRRHGAEAMDGPGSDL
jgi:hypothetical protein